MATRTPRHRQQSAPTIQQRARTSIDKRSIHTPRSARVASTSSQLVDQDDPVSRRGDDDDGTGYIVSAGTQFHMKNSRLRDAIQDAHHPTRAHPLQHAYHRLQQRSGALAMLANRDTMSAIALSPDQLLLARDAMQEQINVLTGYANVVDESTAQHVRACLSPGLVDFSVQANSKRLQSLQDWYVVSNTIGAGTFGLVQLAKHRVSGAKVAIKSYYREKGARTCSPASQHSTSSTFTVRRTVDRKVSTQPVKRTTAATSGAANDALEWKRVRQEAKLMAALTPHSALVSFIESFETPTAIHVVMEYVEGSDLCTLLKRQTQQRLPELETKRLFAQLCAGVAALHGQGVIHRDIKLENILVDAHHQRPHVIDFGFSQYEPINTTGERADKQQQASAEPTQLKNFCGTPSYMAPEVVSCKSYDGRCVDIWSLGIILYLLLCGRFPFHGSNLHQLYQQIRNPQQVTLPYHLSKDVRNLLQQLLVVDPKKRLTMHGIQSHPWMNESCEPVLLSRNEDLFAAFLAWEEGRAMVAATLVALYDVDGIDGVSDGFYTTRKDRPQQRSGLTALIYLTLLCAEKRFFSYWLSVEKEPSVPSSMSGSIAHAPIRRSIVAQDEYREVAKAAPCLGASPASVEPSAHKQQLEKLIGLVKQSMR